MVQEVVIDDEDEDEFEPLFSYQRVCRPSSDDDSDEDVTIVDAKTLHSSKYGHGKVFPGSVLKSKYPLDKRVREDLSKEMEDDDDWLPPPPKSAKVLDNKINEDPTLCELRREREELRRLAASSEAALRKLEEDKRLQTAALRSPETTADGVEGHASSNIIRERVLVTIQKKDGTCKAFKVFKDERFEKLFSIYAESVGHSRQQLVFIFDGQKVSAEDTPKDLDIEDEDIIEVNFSK